MPTLLGPDASKLRITLNPHPVALPNPTDLQFGKHVTDHTLQIPWSATHGWHTPRITPYQPLTLDPTASVFHYGFECFEGMKAYKDASGALRLFRPEINIARLNTSAARVSLPTFDEEQMLALLAKFVEIEGRWIPNIRGYSLYLRPVIIGTNPGLSVSPPTSALLYVVASPVGSYFQSQSQTLSPSGTSAPAGIVLQATPSARYVRAWPGGSGAHKVGANYAPCMVAEQEAKSQGAHQALWLFGDEEEITEAGTMNLFLVLKLEDGERELVTPPLDGMILPGVTRDCVLGLARERLPGWVVSERRITMGELEGAAERGMVEEVFGTGTAAVVTSVGRIRWKGRVIRCGNETSLAMQMRKWIEARQYGEDEHEWSVLVETLVQAPLGDKHQGEAEVELEARL
ncbi:cytosolic branched-chain amino acid aminotransferase [Aspergillus karnatakaensis]|uniref:cytosolic branched-chain amino acid aminotransferase n=1 Tax=Aspergillus karnatakaensis TaxID=1810916 RepID=UPI003CCD95BD